MKPILPVLVPSESDVSSGQLDPGWQSLVELGWPDRADEISAWAAGLPLDSDGGPPRDGELVAALLALIGQLSGKRLAGSVTANRTGLIRLLPEPLPLDWSQTDVTPAKKDRFFPGAQLAVTLRMPNSGTPPAVILTPTLPPVEDNDFFSDPHESMDDFFFGDFDDPEDAPPPSPAAADLPEATTILLPHNRLCADPISWWPLELLLRADPAKIASEWGDGTKEPSLPEDLAQAFLPPGVKDPKQAGMPGSAIRTVLDEAQIPLKPAAGLSGEAGRWALDVERWALDIVHRRYMHPPHERPHLYLATRRPSNMVWWRVLRLLSAVHKGRLFRTSVEPGKSDGLLTLACALGGQDGMKIIKNEDDIQFLLGTSVLFPSPKYGLRQPPTQLVKMMRSTPDPTLPELKGVVRMPICQPDGTIIDRPGYDPVTKEWRDSTVQLNVPDRPTDKQVLAAHDALNVLLQDFSFDAGSGAYAGALACFFDQIIRPLVRARHGPRPLFVFEARAHGQGSGKSLLAMTVAAAITGSSQPAQPWKGREEFAKTVVGALQQGAPFVLIDNVTTMVRNDVLDILLTSTEYSDRQLGVNTVLRLPQNTTWAMTVNGVHLSKDLARRSILSRLEKGEDEPDIYAIKEIIAYAIQHRNTLISAAFTILRAWIQAGQPAGPKIQMRSYHTWIEIMTGLFGFIGVTGLEKCVQAALERDADTGEDRLFIQACVEAGMINRPLKTADLIQVAETHLVYTRRLDKAKFNVQARALSEHLRSLSGLNIAGYRIDLHSERSPIEFIIRPFDAPKTPPTK